MVLEKWSTAALAGAGGGRGLGEERGFLEGVQDRRTVQREGGETRRSALTPTGRQASDQQGGRGAVQVANGAAPNKPKHESLGEVQCEGKSDKSWAQVVATKKKKIATRPKAAAAPPAASKEAKGSAAVAEEVREELGSEEQVTVPPRYSLPMPRVFMEGRIAALRKRIQELEQGGQPRKLRRARARLEEAEAEYKDAGGGNGLRAYFSLVNERKRITRLEKALDQAHKEIEDADEQEILVQTRKKKAYATAEKYTRELENSRSKLAYLSLQNAQEAGQMAHGYGARQAVEAI